MKNEKENKYLNYLNDNYFHEKGFIHYEPHVKTQRTKNVNKGEKFGR
jgi:hypothetical protein|tara:strand:+ start:151 stop:291 length:141 start_codon:yes stop_codon:yes gene_type:complete